MFHGLHFLSSLSLELHVFEMLSGIEISLIDVQQHTIFSFLASHLFLGVERSSPSFPD